VLIGGEGGYKRVERWSKTTLTMGKTHEPRGIAVKGGSEGETINNVCQLEQKRGGKDWPKGNDAKTTEWVKN